MIDQGKKNILGVLVNAIDYDSAVSAIVSAAEQRRAYSATALAVHGVVTGLRDKTHRHRLNGLDLVTPDGQPIRWMLNFAYSAGLPDRVYGPSLMLRVCEEAAARRLPIFLYGSEPRIVKELAAKLQKRFPEIEIAGFEPSRFRKLSEQERAELAGRIQRSGARVMFVGLGCPRQEVFVYEFRELLAMPILAVGAAFEYHAGFAKEPPSWVQRAGMQWLHRLAHDPRRLWRRYLVLNTIFAGSILLQLLGVFRPDANDTKRPEADVLYG